MDILSYNVLPTCVFDNPVLLGDLQFNEYRYTIPMCMFESSMHLIKLLLIPILFNWSPGQSRVLE